MILIMHFITCFQEDSDLSEGKQCGLLINLFRWWWECRKFGWGMVQVCKFQVDFN